MKDITPHNIETLISLIADAQKPVIVTHAKPDGDAIGSSSAMLHFIMQTCGKTDAKLILNDNCPRYLSFIKDSIPANALIIREESKDMALDAISCSDLVICLDFHAFHRTGALEAPLAECKAKKILIDHHLDPDRSIYELSFSQNDISSASELLFWILMATPQIGGNAENLPIQSATALMTGMTTDTNNFGNSVYPSTLNMASELLRIGVDRDFILQKINQEHSESRLRLKGFVLKELMKVTKDGVAYIVLDRKAQFGYKMQEGDTEGFVNEPLSIGKVRMSIFAREDAGEVRISIRSKRGTSANRCAKLFFNGGGHENAAGGKLYMPIEEVGDYIAKHTHIYMTEYED